MKLSTFKRHVKGHLKQATVVFIIKNEYILLGHKKRGFGQNKWNGVGGKVESGESFEESAIRETEEEVGLKLTKKDLEHVATLHFYFPDIPIEKNYNQKVYAFFVKWNKKMGEPEESEEIYPKWYKIDELPFKDMWEDDKTWLPKALSGERFEAEFSYTQDEKTGILKVSEYQIKSL